MKYLSFDIDRVAFLEQNTKGHRIADAVKGKEESLLLMMAARSVPCPLAECNAKVGEACKGKPYPEHTHFVRYAALKEQDG